MKSLKIPHSKKSEKIIYTAIEVLVILALVPFIIRGVSGGEDLIFLIPGILLLILTPALIILYGNYYIDNTGIAFKSLLFRKKYRWSEIRFIAKFSADANQYVRSEGYVISKNEEKQNFRSAYLFRIFTPGFMIITQADERLRDYIAEYSPEGIFKELNDI